MTISKISVEDRGTRALRAARQRASSYKWKALRALTTREIKSRDPIGHSIIPIPAARTRTAPKKSFILVSLYIDLRAAQFDAQP